MSVVSPASPAPVSLPARSKATGAEDWATPGAVDGSCRVPVVFLCAKAIGWLVLGLLLAMIASIQSHGPGFLADTPWLTLGRVRPAAMNALVYGFASQAALGVMVWMIARLGRQPLLGGGVILFAAVLWNVALLLGILAILAGHSTGFAWLELPRFFGYMLFLAYALVGIWAGINFHYRRERQLYVSQWYLLAALFWFPWIYSAANYLLLVDPVRGVLQGLVNAWYKNNLVQLWLVPVGLGTVYYFIPKLAARPLYSLPLAKFGFWTHAVFAGWTGLTELIGGPFPSWMISASISANLLMLVPLVSTGLNWHLTLAGGYDRARGSRVLSFVLFGAGCYLLAGLESILIHWRSVSRVTQFTFVPVACTHLVLLGFVGMVLFGAMYFILPNLLGAAWPSEKMARAHFWCSAAGVVLYFASATMGGLVHGLKMNNPSIDFVSTVRAALPFLGLATLGLLMLFAGQVILWVHFWLLVRQHLRSAGAVGCCGWLRAVLPGRKGAQP